ncbi:integrase core domain-containing protein [Streptomyces brasiliscabiei]|uniref:integrase core domain-containing protein n=1 Tax=Streptomyces brasiliscabiei TaxID=2736302 RepID=UPI0038F5FC7C
MPGRPLQNGVDQTPQPWHGLADAEISTAEWVNWFNNQRRHTAIGDIPPHGHETNYSAQHQPQPAAGVNA